MNRFDTSVKVGWDRQGGFGIVLFVEECILLVGIRRIPYRSIERFIDDMTGNMLHSFAILLNAPF